MMKIINRFVLLISGILILACAEGQEKTSQEATSPQWEEVFDSQWAQDSFWDDGLAEVAHYDAERKFYGKIRSFDFVFILVKETFNGAYNVKTDDYSRDDLFDVFKANQFARIETDNYPYHWQGSVFFDRASFPSLHKYSHSSQEWCGNTFKLMEKRPNSQFRYQYHSYFDGQGDGETLLKESFLVEDQLFAAFRALRFEDVKEFTLPVLESQMSNKAPADQLLEAKGKVSETASDSTGQRYWKVELSLSNGKKCEYHYEMEYPNLMLHYEDSEGMSLRLRESKRAAYWKK